MTKGIESEKKTLIARKKTKEGRVLPKAMHHMRGVTNPELRRLGLRGNVRSIRGDAFDEIRALIYAYLHRVISDSMTFMAYQNRQTINPSDVFLAVRNNGRTLYGFGVEKQLADNTGAPSKHPEAAAVAPAEAEKKTETAK